MSGNKFVLARGESFHLCPYEPTHILTNVEEEIRGHVRECRDNFFWEMGFKGIPVEYAICQYSETHKVPRIELEYHEVRCLNKFRVDPTHPSPESDNKEPSPNTSSSSDSDIKHDVNPLSCIDTNHEIPKENPFLQPTVLACLCENSSPQALFNYRLVGQHIWNEMAVNAINQDRSVGVRLVKVVDPNIMNGTLWTGTGGVIVNIKELLSTLRTGELKKSTLTRIYVSYSLAHSDLSELLQINGQNIRTLHYDGKSWKGLKQILQTCANNLTSLSLWRSWDENEDDSQGLLKSDDYAYATLKLPRLESLVIVSGELDPSVTTIDNGRNVCNPSKEFLSHIFQASPNLKSLSARFYESYILDSGLCFKNLSTLCIKFKIRNIQLTTLCYVGLRLKTLRLQGLFMKRHGERGAEELEFRKILLHFIQTQAQTLEYFAVSLFMPIFVHPTHWPEHDSPHQQWISSRKGFPIMPNLHTFILHESAGKIPKEEFGDLFPKLRNLEIVGCGRYSVYLTGPQEPNIVEHPVQITDSPVQNIRLTEVKLTMELAQAFPAVTELHIKNNIPHELPHYWPKLKHLYYKDSFSSERQTRVELHVREIAKFLVGISPEESERIEELQYNSHELNSLPLARSQPSIFDLNELETFEFKFFFGESFLYYRSPETETALGVLITLGLKRLTHLKKLNVLFERKPEQSLAYPLHQNSLDDLANAFERREDCHISTNCNNFGWVKPVIKKWNLQLNLDHHKSEWTEIDGLFRDDPDICELGSWHVPEGHSTDEEDDV